MGEVIYQGRLLQCAKGSERHGAQSERDTERDHQDSQNVVSVGCTPVSR